MASIRPDRSTVLSLGSERPPAPKRACLVIVSGNEAGRRIELEDEEVVIGRGSECPACVNDDSVSRRHAVITTVLGQTFVLDLESTNGTFVDEVRVERAELRDGQVLHVGKVALKYIENHLETDYIQHVLGLANTDTLTGLFNRGYFDECFVKEVARAHSSQQPCSLILFDVDHFKRINDSHGHLVGDEVLRHVAAVSQGVLARGQSAFRVGGEEFAVILDEADHVAAGTVAEQIRAAVAASVCLAGAAQIATTLSLGVAQLRAGESAAELYQRADTQLYAAKHAGRNCVA